MGGEFLYGGLERPLKVKPGLDWKPQDVRDAKLWNTAKESGQQGVELA